MSKIDILADTVVRLQVDVATSKQVAHLHAEKAKRLQRERDEAVGNLERREYEFARQLSPRCRQHGHLFVRDYFFGFPVGKPYCMRCGATP